MNNFDDKHNFVHMIRTLIIEINDVASKTQEVVDFLKDLSNSESLDTDAMEDVMNFIRARYRLIDELMQTFYGVTTTKSVSMAMQEMIDVMNRHADLYTNLDNVIKEKIKLMDIKH